MYRITDEQIDYILNDIRRNGVDMEDLQLNLLDHICCIIEQELGENDDFGRFYHSMLPRFYKKELHEIEEETINLLTFKNYYAMKKSMIISGAFSAIAFVIGSFFKVMHWPGTAVLLVSAIIVFTLVFLPLVFLLKTKEAGTKRDKIILTMGTVVGILYCLSMLFLIQHWNGARIIWLSTLGLCFFILVPLYFFSGIRKPETKMNTIVTTILLMGFLGLQFTMTALKPSTDIYGKVYTYLQSEQLLEKSMQTESAPNVALQDIQTTCVYIKKMILKDLSGTETIPADFEAREMVIKDSYYLGRNGWDKVLAQLRKQVDAYNAAQSNDAKIPVAHTILEEGFAEKNFCSELFVLNNITQIQLSMVHTKKTELAMK